jgi:hypothetical protein
MTTELQQFENRHSSVARTNFPDIHSALAWAVQTYDRDYEGHEFVKIHIENYMTSGPLPEDEFVPAWSAYVSGGKENQHWSGEH